MPFVSRAGTKLAHALETFQVDPADKICIDFGCSTGGFTDCLLQNNAQKVHAVDTGYGVLEWKLRQDPKVITHERQNALHFDSPELADLITIDTSWTKQEKILPIAQKLLKSDGKIITLVKPHYEAQKAQISDPKAQEVLKKIITYIEVETNLQILDQTNSPLRGNHGHNPEFLLLLALKKTSFHSLTSYLKRGVVTSIL